MPPRRRGTPKDPERTRRLILDAALRIFSAVGYRGTRMSDVAKEAGFSEAAVFHHFGSKTELFKEVVTSIDEDSPWFDDGTTPEVFVQQMYSGELRYHRDGRWRSLDRVWSEALAGEQDLLRLMKPALEGTLDRMDDLLSAFDTAGHPDRRLLARLLMAVSYGSRVLRRYDPDALSAENGADLLRFACRVVLASLAGEGPKLEVTEVPQTPGTPPAP